MSDYPLMRTSVVRNWSALKIAGLYLLIGSLWILFSDQLAAIVASSPAMLTTLSMLKGWGYVVVTALLLYWLIRRHTTALLESAEQLRQVTDAMPALISYIDADKRYQFNNRAYEEWFGHARAEVQGKHPEEVLGTAAYQAISKYVEAALGGQAVTYETEMPYRDSGTRFIHADYIPDMRADGQVKGFFALVSDITERKRMEQALHLTQFCVDQALVGIMRTGPDGRILSVNDHVCRSLGYSAEELCKLNIFDLDPSFPFERWWEHRQALRVKGSDTFETVHRRKDGTTFPVEVTANYLEFQGSGFSFSFIRDITERKRAETALRELTENMAAAQRIAHFGSWEVKLSADLEFIEPYLWSDECYRIFGFEPGAVEITSEILAGRIHPEDREPTLQAFFKAVQDRVEYSQEYRIVLPDGAVRYIHDQAKVVLDERTGHPVKVVGMAHDITERRQAEQAQAKLEDQLRQAQKMESIGRLAGGVAHDFNNLLTVIQGHCDLMQVQMSDADPLLDELGQIRHAGARAAALTQQLLAFSRKQILAPIVLDLNSLVANLGEMLERLIGEDITLTTALQPELWSVTADPGQIEQVIMNLTLNARDAMPGGGRLTIETRNVQLDATYAKTHPEAPAGACVLLAVGDTGSGMDELTRARVFEPFFTTKEPGKGTGLGLATVYGIIKQSGGDILVYSEAGQGTIFKIYLPASQMRAKSPVAAKTWPVSRGGHETILLVEDEEMVRDLVRTVLQSAGYTILEAGNGGEALSLAGQHQGTIDLLVTDLVMPEMSGRELAERLKALRPGIKVLFMSGYTDDVVVRHGLLAADVEFLPKPFSPGALASKVRKVLDQAKPTTRSQVSNPRD
jgi:two-component system cell cycle sensor histidine kinase/response regulator CckA